MKLNNSARKEEANGEGFSDKGLLDCQSSSWDILNQLAKWIKPDVSESEAKARYFEICTLRGIEKQWHPPQIRFGVNSILPFGEKAEDQRLKKDDIFFLDLGPIINGFEGDVGRAFTVGNDASLEKIVQSGREIFEEVKTHFLKHNISGKKLYYFAANCANSKDLKISLKGASGHRVGDFPHAIHFRGKLKEVDFDICANRWILEIHVINEKINRGAFFEDLL